MTNLATYMLFFLAIMQIIAIAVILHLVYKVFIEERIYKKRKKRLFLKRKKILESRGYQYTEYCWFTKEWPETALVMKDCSTLSSIDFKVVQNIINEDFDDLIKHIDKELLRQQIKPFKQTP